MSVITGVAKALTGAKSTTRVSPKTKWTLVVAVGLLTLVAFAALIAASQATNAKHY